MTQGGFLEEEGFFSEEPEPWRPPVRCPQCNGVQTRFLAMRYEVSVYECEACGLQFEADEEGS